MRYVFIILRSSPCCFAPVGQGGLCQSKIFLVIYIDRGKALQHKISGTSVRAMIGVTKALHVIGKTGVRPCHQHSGIGLNRNHGLRRLMWLHKPKVHRLAVIYAGYLVIGYRNQRIPLAGFHLVDELHDLVRRNKRGSGQELYQNVAFDVLDEIKSKIIIDCSIRSQLRGAFVKRDPETGGNFTKNIRFGVDIDFIKAFGIFGGFYAVAQQRFAVKQARLFLGTRWLPKRAGIMAMIFIQQFYAVDGL